MARYIDADAVEKRIVDYYDAQLQSYPSSKDNKEKERLLGGINYGRNVVRDAPTADVVPKSEVEKLIKSVDDMLDLVCAMTGIELTYFGKYAELKKKYIKGD